MQMQDNISDLIAKNGVNAAIKSPANARITRDSAVIPRWPSATILDIIEPEIAPFDPPTPKPLPRTRHGVDLMHCLRDSRI